MFSYCIIVSIINEIHILLKGVKIYDGNWTGRNTDRIIQRNAKSNKLQVKKLCFQRAYLTALGMTSAGSFMFCMSAAI